MKTLIPKDSSIRSRHNSQSLPYYKHIILRERHTHTDRQTDRQRQTDRDREKEREDRVRHAKRERERG